MPNRMNAPPTNAIITPAIQPEIRSLRRCSIDKPTERFCLILCPMRTSFSLRVLLEKMAERTGLEPATTRVTGGYSNQLNYRSTKLGNFFWWVLRDSNPRHSPCKGDALPTELSTQSFVPHILHNNQEDANKILQ